MLLIYLQTHFLCHLATVILIYSFSYRIKFTSSHTGEQILSMFPSNVASVYLTWVTSCSLLYIQHLNYIAVFTISPNTYSDSHNILSGIHVFPNYFLSIRSTCLLPTEVHNVSVKVTFESIRNPNVPQFFPQLCVCSNVCYWLEFQRSMRINR